MPRINEDQEVRILAEKLKIEKERKARLESEIREQEEKARQLLKLLPQDKGGRTHGGR